MVQALYDFWLKELADNYIEAVKPVMSGQDAEAKKAAQNTLFICLDQALRLLHPTMPYITEELFQRLPAAAGSPESLVIAEFPKECVSFADEGVEDVYSQLQLVVGKFRSQLADLGITRKHNPVIYIRASDPKIQKVFAEESAVFTSLIKAGETHVLGKDAAEPEGCLKSFINESLEIYVKVVGVIDVSLEVKRIDKRQAQLTDLATKLKAKIEAPGYADKVPEKVRTENAEKLASYERELAENVKAAERLSKLL